MSIGSKSAAFGARPVRGQGISPVPSNSAGVTVAINGWRPGLNKVALTQTFRDGGIPLAQAARLTGEVLEGRPVVVRLSQFSSRDSAVAALQAMGAVAE